MKSRDMDAVTLIIAVCILAVAVAAQAAGKGAGGQGDTKPPTSHITAPLNGATLPTALWSYSIKGSATDGSGSGVWYVEVSTDDGFTWARAADSSGGSWKSWIYKWALSFSGNYTIKSRAVDNAGNQEAPGKGIKVRVSTIP